MWLASQTQSWEPLVPLGVAQEPPKLKCQFENKFWVIWSEWECLDWLILECSTHKKGNSRTFKNHSYLLSACRRGNIYGYYFPCDIPKDAQEASGFHWRVWAVEANSWVHGALDAMLLRLSSAGDYLGHSCSVGGHQHIWGVSRLLYPSTLQETIWCQEMNLGLAHAYTTYFQPLDISFFSFKLMISLISNW